MTPNLLPCPFCGDDEIMDFQEHLENRVQCAMCNVSTDTFPSCEESHTAWNTRAKSTPAEPVQEPVGIVEPFAGVAHAQLFRALPAGTKLYAAPQPSDDVAMLRKQLDEARELLTVASEIIHEQCLHIDSPMTDLGSEALTRLDDWLEANP